jgi:hypothetical protein
MKKPVILKTRTLHKPVESPSLSPWHDGGSGLVELRQWVNPMYARGHTSFIRASQQTYPSRAILVSEDIEIDMSHHRFSSFGKSYRVIQFFHADGLQRGRAVELENPNTNSSLTLSRESDLVMIGCGIVGSPLAMKCLLVKERVGISIRKIHGASLISFHHR